LCYRDKKLSVSFIAFFVPLQPTSGVVNNQAYVLKHTRGRARKA
jgi:hypothetical protein